MGKSARSTIRGLASLATGQVENLSYSQPFLRLVLFTERHEAQKA